MTRRTVIYVLSALVTLVAVAWLWQQCKPYESNAIAVTTWTTGGTTFLVAVTVTDRSGAPLPGLYVDVLNSSGGDGDTTDARGRIVIEMGEKDLMGLSLNGVRVVDRPYAAEIPFSPNVSKGLEVRVTVKDVAAVGIKQAN